MSDNKCSIHGCGSDGHAQSSSCSCKGQCGCKCGQCCCQKSCHEEQECHFSKKLIEIADEAWMEVLADRIKERIKASSGQSLDELAKIVVDANAERWKFKMAKKKGCHDFEEKVEQFFNKK